MKNVLGRKHGIAVGIVATEGVCKLWPPHKSIINSSLFIMWHTLASICGGK